ncbi:DUF6194 family protein [Kutzneria kofuensis]|uniref:DUF6194 domain-containing protein n=1 Tax=Kutzneria kofuensis TaxID=103725 RepID=A0A7W9NKQ7_9PSEU|nr:DUF6194 family protein [Kutzneria kofuensis]MBB5895944.1 hypothetical protein [Kutzneria kofuensis]
MEIDELIRHITDTYAGVRVAEHAGDSFFLYDPDGDLPPERQLPFVTIVTGDHYERDSELDRDGAYRVNIGLTKAGYAELFAASTVDDYTPRDTLLPHPVYAGQHWVCVINPGERTADTVLKLIADAYEFAARKHGNRR